MIGEDDVIHVTGRVARHVARGAIVAISLPLGSRTTAIGGLMATQAFATKVRGLLVVVRNGMGIVARAAP